MKIELVIPGQSEPAAKAAMRGGPPGAEAEHRVTDLLDAVEVVEGFSLSPSARARSATPARVEVNSDDILEVEVEGGFTLWTSVERYRSDLAVLRPDAVRGEQVMFDLLPRPSVSERGVREWVASALRILRLPSDDALAAEVADPTKWAEFLSDFGLGQVADAGAWLTTKFLIWLIERRNKLGEGLYHWADATRPPTSDAPVAVADLTGFDAEQAMLVFIHGTASSTLGSFGALRDAEADWRVISESFGDRVFAFDHRTMSTSPIENAIRLAQALPARARLSLVTHSRGGLVGDLLCLRGIDADAIGRVRRDDETLAEADALDRRNLQTLAEVLAAKQFRIERFLRCASPARGTLLASENTDQFLSVLTNLVGLIPGLAGSPLYEVVKRVTLQVAKNRWQPSMLPGIEAMTPTSPLVHFLNAQRGETQGALGVIAGDIEGGHWLKRLGVFLTDRFIYENRDNDLVVNTDSMFEGARAQAGSLRVRPGWRRHPLQLLSQRAHARRAMLRWVTAQGNTVPAEFRERTRIVRSSRCRCCARSPGAPAPRSRSSSCCRASWART